MRRIFASASVHPHQLYKHRIPPKYEVVIRGSPQETCEWITKRREHHELPLYPSVGRQSPEDPQKPDGWIDSVVVPESEWVPVGLHSSN